MKQIAVIVSLSLLMACGSGGNNSKEAELDSYRKKVEEYTLKIKELEAELETELGDEPEASALAADLPVEIRKMIPEQFSRYFEVRGAMEALEEAYLSAELNGQIQEVRVQRGERVKKGDTIIKLNTDVTEKSIDEVKTNLQLARRIYSKQQELWDQNIGSEIQYLEAKNNMESLEARLATLEKQLAMSYVTAPFSGIIDDIMLKAGELASPGTPLAHLLNLKNMRVSAEVSEAYLDHISKGDLVALRFPNYPDELIEAPVSRLGEVIDPQTRTFSLELELKNPGEKFKPNMLTSVRVWDFRDTHALVVPSHIIREDFQGTFLFRISDENGSPKAQKVYVERGITVQDQTMIIDGLLPGDLVITKGYNLVAEGSSVRIMNP